MGRKQILQLNSIYGLAVPNRPQQYLIFYPPRTGSRVMRTKKLTIGHSTKAERRFHEMLKKSHIPFKTKVRIQGREVDFLIGKTIIEIDGHHQDVQKNKKFAELGYNVIHFNNWEIDDNLIEWLNIIK